MTCIYVYPEESRIDLNVKSARRLQELIFGTNIITAEGKTMY